MYARFINTDEAHLIKYLFVQDKKLAERELNNYEIEQKIVQIKKSLEENILKIVMIFSDDGSPYAMRSGFYMKKAAAWYLSATKLLKSENHYNITARNISLGLNLLISHMEAVGYYKFWNAGPVNQQNLRTKIMCKYSSMLSRYQWFDELIIPKGTRSDIEAYEIFRNISNESDIMIRLFVLDQKYRSELLKK